MRRLVMLALCSGSLVAINLAAATASAAPAFYTKAAIGEVAKGVPFTATVGAAFIEAHSGSKMTCTGGTADGEATGVTTTKGTAITFVGCETSGFKCESGATEGVIVTNVLEGTLGGVTASLPGLRLFPEGSGRGGEVAAFSCAGGTITWKVKGSVIGTLSGAAGSNPAGGKLSPTVKLTYSQSLGVEKYTKFLEGEGGEEQLEASVAGGAYERYGWSTILTLTSTPGGNLGFTV